MNRFDVLKFHRRIALWVAAAFLIWGMSGLIHPVMSWTNPRPVAFAPPPSAPVAVPPLSVVKSALGDMDVQTVRIWPGAVWADGDVHALKGSKPLPDMDRDRAVTLARYYSGEISGVSDTTLITAFDDKYPYINRYLPAWRVSFDNGKTVYVETGTDRLGSITDRRKVILQTVFENLHTLKFMDGIEPARVAMIAALVGSIPLMALMGAFLHAVLRRRASGPRQYHRLITLAGAVPLLCFGVSGLFHLGMQSPLVYETLPVMPATSVKDMRFMPDAGQVDDLRLVAGWWRVEKAGEVSYRNAASGQTLKGDEAFARHLATQWGSGDIAGISIVTKFTPEYGFANKRLPVFRVEPVSGPLMFIEARTATMAAMASRVAAAETWAFSNLHKWQFIASRPWRDGLMVFVVLLGFAGVYMGLRIRR